MGIMSSALEGKADRFGYSCLTIPIMFARPLDYNVAGCPRPTIQNTWELAMRSMVTVELITRKLLYPVIESRMRTMSKEENYKQEMITQSKNSILDESQVLEFHDIFQIFEIDPDGTINTAELIMELENFEDTTPLKTRVEIIGQYDDGRNRMSFQNFLRVMEFLQQPENVNHTLRQTFEKLREINRYLRQMTVTQQVLTGFL